MTESAFSPVFDRGQNISLTTAADGTDFIAFASQALSQLTVVNDTGVDVEFVQDSGTVALTIFASTTFSIFGIANASQIGVRRKDLSTTQVVVKARWEA